MRKRRDDKRVSKFMVYFVGIIMVSSVFGVVFFGFGSNTQSMKYNGFKFVNRGDHFSVKLAGNYALFTYLPQDVEGIKTENNAIDRLKNVLQIDITSDFNDTLAQPIALAQYQMGITLNNFNIFLRNGFTDNNESDFPAITCNDATQFVPVSYFKGSNETKISLKNNCIIAEASDGRDIIKVKDRIMYGIFGIVN